MSERTIGSAAGRVQPEDDAAREARHDVLATLLAAYVDGELPPETTAQIDAHLLGCVRCRREVAVHQSLTSRLSQVTRPAVSADLNQRWRTAIAAAPIVAPSADVTTMPTPGGAATEATGPRRRISGILAAVVALAVVLVVALIIALVVGARARQPTPVALQTAPLVVRVAVPQLERVAADFRAASARDLPGRARDLETVRRAVPFPIVPLRSADLLLVAAWTTDLDGEVAAVLAYKWRDSLVLQYVVSDAWLFRSLPLRAAFSDGRAVAVQAPDAGMLVWSSVGASTVVVADRAWPSLVGLYSRER